MPNLSFQDTMDRLTLLIRAGYPIIYINSHEEARVLDCLARIVNRVRQTNPGKQLWRWYEGTGLERLKNPGSSADTGPETPWLDVPGLPAAPQWDPHPQDRPAHEAVRLIGDEQALGNILHLANGVMVFFDLHPYLRMDGDGGAGPMVRPLRNTAAKLRRYYDANRGQSPHRYNTIVVVAPTDDKLSPELDRDLIRLDFPLPESDELLKTLSEMVERKVLAFPESATPAESEEFEREVETVCPNAAGLGPEQLRRTYENRLSDMIANAGRGLTLEDYKLGLNMFAVTGQALNSRRIEDMLHLKAKSINNQALQYTPHVKIELGGLEGVKEWVRLRKDPIISVQVRSDYHLPSPKGVMLCGVSGGGKSQLAKLIAKEFNLALLRLDVGALFGSYVGESESHTRAALRMAEVLAPVVLWIDEIDKAFTGLGSGGDNGVSARVFGHFLTWLAEKQDNVFVVTTANDFLKLLDPFPEFGRKGRFDEIFWVDLPKADARYDIFEIYLKKFEKDYPGIGDYDGEDVLGYLRSEAIFIEPAADGEKAPFLSLLSNDSVSGNMTGAEIEYAISEALYEAYKRDQQGPSRRDKFTPLLILETVMNANRRALHRREGSAHKGLEELRSAAKANNWIFV